MKSESSKEVISRYLRDAIETEKHFGQQVLIYAAEGDDPAVLTWFQTQAANVAQRVAELKVLLQVASAEGAENKILSRIFGGRGTHTLPQDQEQGNRTSQKLIASFGAMQSFRAMYESLANMAEAAGDSQIAAMARHLENDGKRAAAEITVLLKLTSRREFEHFTQ